MILEPRKFRRRTWLLAAGLGAIAGIISMVTCMGIISLFALQGTGAVRVESYVAASILDHSGRPYVGVELRELLRHEARHQLIAVSQDDVDSLVARGQLRVILKVRDGHPPIFLRDHSDGTAWKEMLFMETRAGEEWRYYPGVQLLTRTVFDE